MRCPRDSWILQEEDVCGHRVHRCPGCGGVVLQLTNDWSGQFDWEALGKGEYPAGNPLAESELLLPVTGKPMRIFHYRGVELDYCPESQIVWLDRGELEKITDLKRARNLVK